MNERADNTAPDTQLRVGAWWVFAAGLLLGVFFGFRERMLVATVVFAAACLIAAAMRAMLTEERAGILVVRSRWVDVTLLVLAGIAVGLIGQTMNLNPQV